MKLLTYRLVDPIGQIFLKRYQLTTLRRVQPLVVELELFLFRRGSRHISAIEDGNRGRTPATAITSVLGGRESVGVRHRGAVSPAENPGAARRILLRSFSPCSTRVLFQDPLHSLRQFPGYLRATSCRNVRLAIKWRLRSKKRKVSLSRDGVVFENRLGLRQKLVEGENRNDKTRHETFLRKRREKLR